ncbi:MAG TPA: hypothetical protein VGR35_07085 [Tepidisphaeraceae bacterium]|nr:hypothetical protein [Tepidisphaeraceae bacterium]
MLAQNLPGVNRSLAAVTNISQLLQTKLSAPVNALGSTPSPDNIKSALELVLGPSTVTALSTATEIRFDVNTTLNAAPVQVTLDLGQNSDALSLDEATKLTLNSAVSLNFSFGLTLGEGLAASEAFFVKLKTDNASNPTGFKVTGSVATNSFSFPLGGKVGFLEVGIGDGTAASTIALGAEIKLGLNDPNPTDGHITLAELTGNSLSALVALPAGSATGTINASIPVSASLGTYSAAGTIAVTDANVFDSTKPVVSFTAANPLKNFKNITPRDAVAMLQQLGASLQGITDSLSPIGGIPFLQDTLGDVLNFGDEFFAFSGGFFDALFKNADSYTASNLAPTDGVLSDQVVLKVAVGGGAEVQKTLAAGDYASVAGLAAALDGALAGTGVSADTDGSRIRFFSDTAGTTFSLRFAGDNRGMRQVGFVATLANAELKFDSVQTFLDRLNQLDLLGTLGALEANYVNNALTFKLRIDQQFHEDLEFHFGDAIDVGIAELSITGHAHAHFDVEVALDLTLGIDITPLGGAFTLAPSTLLKNLNGGTTFFDSPDGTNDFKILLSNGSTKLVNLDSLTGMSTVADLQSLIQGIGGGSLTLTLVPDANGQTAQNAALRLIDSSGGTSALKVERLNNSLGARVLGIEGADVIPDDGLSQITGAALHGDSFLKHIFLKEGSKLDASATLEVPDDDKINLIAALNILEVGIVDGEGSLSIGTGLVLNDPGTGAAADARVHLDELLSSPLRAVVTAAAVGPANGQLSANGAFNLNVNGIGSVAVTLNKDAANTSLGDLIKDIQTALGATSFTSAYDGTAFEGKKLGDVIFAGSKDGKLTLTGLVGSVAISFTTGNPANQLGFTSGATSPASLIESGYLTASGSLHLPLTFPGIEFLQLVSPADPSIDLSFSSGSPINFIPSVAGIPNTEDILKLIDFDTADFLTMLQQIVSVLKNKDLGLLNKPLPLLDNSINDLLAFADPIVASLDALMAKMGNLKQSLLQQLRGAAEDVTDPESIRGLIAGANGTALMGGLEQLQPGLALKFANALDSLEGAIQTLPDSINLASFSLPGRIVAAIGQFKEVIGEARQVIKDAGGAASAEVKTLFNKLEGKVYALKRAVPGVQQLSDFLFEALGLRDLIKESMFTTIKTTVVNKIQQATDAIDAGVNDAHAAAKQAFQKVHDDLQDVLAPVVNFSQDVSKLDLVALLQVFNNLIGSISVHSASGVLTNDPAIADQPLDLLNEALGAFSSSFPGRLRFNFDPATKRLAIGLDVGLSGSNAQPIGLDFSLEDVPGVSGVVPVTLKTGGEIAAGAAAIGANLAFNFGLALDPADTADFVFLYPTTQLAFTALVEATGLSITAGIGGINAALENGSFLIKKDIADPANHEPAALTLTLDNAGGDANSNGLVEFSELLSSVKVTPVGGLKLDFQDVSVAGVSLGDNLGITVPLDTLFDTSTWTFEVPTFDFSDIKLDLSSLFAGIDAFLGFVITAFESKLLQQLPLVGDDLGAAALVIDDFRDLLAQIKTVADTITEATTAAGIQEALQKLLFDTLGPGLPSSDTSVFNLSVTPLNILALDKNHHDDGAGNSTADYRDLDLVVKIDEDGADDDLSTTADNKNLLTDPDAAIEARFAFAGEETWNPTFDIGFDAFGLVGAAAEGGIDLTLAYHAEVGVKLDKQHGFSILLNPAGGSPDLPGTPATGQDPELEAGVTLALQDNTKLSLNLFFLTLSAANQDTDGDGKKTQFEGAAALDFDFGGASDVPLLELTNIGITPALAMNVLVDMRLNAGLGDNPNLPSIRADLVADWGFDLSKPEADRISDLNLALNNLGLDLGLFISNNLKPILERVTQFLEPVRPLLDFLQLEVPIVSQLYQLIGQGPFTFLDGIALLGEGGESVAKVIGLLTDIDTFASQITSLENLFLEFGDFDFGNIGNGSATLDAEQFAQVRSLTAAFGAMSFTDQNGDPVDATTAKDKLTNADEEEGGLGIDFPLITNPANILKLLLGQDADLITWDIPRLAAKFDFAQLFGPVVPPFPIFAKIGGGFEIFLDLYVGMDTRGIRTGIESGQPGDFLKGFYFGDFAHDSTGAEVPEAGISLYLTAGAELNIPFAKAGVEGGIKAEINADWHDEGSPGKVYLDEVLLNLQRGVECIFDLNGKLSAFLGAYLEIVIPLGFTNITIIDVSFTIVEVTLLDFSITCPPLPPPEPATLDGSILRLNIGDRAAQRQPGAPDGDEVITVRGEYDINGDGTLSPTVDRNGDGKISEEELGEDLDNNGTADNGVVAVIGFGQTRLFGRSANATLPASFFKGTTLITGIVGNGGAGEDSITLDNVKVGATLTGGAGDDEIVGSLAGDSLEGGDGDDQIVGNGGNDVIKGDGGNDELLGNDGSDTIDGGSGDDTIYGGNNNNKEGNDAGDSLVGGAGNDRMYGHAGNDTMHGGAGADFLGGSTGADSLTGGDDNDTLLGEEGADKLFGNSGDDQLKGGQDSDSLDGGSGHDWMAGGQGNDTLRGATGNDSMIGGGSDSNDLDNNGHDLIDGGAGNEIIAGDDAAIGSITLIGGAGNDTITGGSGDDLIYGQGGLDIVYGDDATFSGANAPQYDSSGIGTGGNDTIHGNDGADIIVAGDGADKVFGGDDSAVDVVLGDNGSITLNTSGIVLDVQSSHFTFGGNDTIRGGAGDDIVIGGFVHDSILGNEGHDIILGDHGRIERNADNSLKKVSSTGTDQGGRDSIQGYDGDDTVLGGTDDDSITGNSGADIVLGDNGEVNYVSGVITTILSTAVSHFGDDLITGAENDDTIIGGSGQDNLSGGSQNDIVIGDNARVTRAGGFVTRIETTNPGTGDDDTILGGTGADTAFGGDGDDSIRGGDDASDDVLAGDNGFITLAGGIVTLIESTDPTQGGSDSIWGGNGNDIIIGGSGGTDLTTAVPPAGDSLFGEGGEDIMVGDNVRITRHSSNLILEIKTIHPDKGGLDRMYGAAGSDTMLGGFGSDSMEGGFAGDVMLGDNGLLDYDIINSASVLVLITTTDPTLGDSDLMYGQDGDDTIMGGTNDESIGGGDGRDLIFGDHGKVDLTLPSNENFFSIDTAADDGGGTDTIHGDADEDTILGGQGGDSIFGDGQDDDIAGGHNNSSDAFGGRADGDDTLDGGAGNDVMAGDNAQVVRQTGPVYSSPLIRTLNGAVIYGLDGSAQVNGARRANPSGVALRNITLLDHADNTPAGRFGDDLMTGGADNDTMFGQLGDDRMRGDGFVDTSGVSALATKSVSNTTDGDDYMEGNGGDDTMFGDLGQDDMAGGSSDLFGLITPAMRPDGADLMYGGDGTDLLRNTLGDTSATGHARDADVMMGDNANILRLVSVSGDTTTYLAFTYDNYGTLKIIPRATTPLDYHPLTPAGDEIGAGDLMHGEAGDDSMYGMTGHDTMFGEGQDDDIIAGLGNDWMSGGTGSDGLLGDDGRIATSRNGWTEPLSGVTVATSQTLISTPGKIQTATIHVTGTLKKVVNLTPFSTDPTWAGQADEFADGSYDHTSDDVIYGGWGNDSMHGGSGDDAISGAEALPLAAAFLPGIGVIVTGYNNPVNIGNMLAFNPEDPDSQHFDRTRRAGEFALYDEYNPLARIVINDAGTLRQFLLNFDPSEGPIDPLSTSSVKKRTDGDDKIFGDLGNDWLVGGTGRDNLYGGFGNDLMNADDDHGTNGGLNDAPDTDASYEDRAYGGAGRDVLIGNTGGDRLIDWVGEFNSYLVPFAPFGMGTVSRTLQPQLPEFLLALSAADGADPTRAADTGADPVRNGEPEGELGMILQKDAAWRQQTGAPADPQAGNIPGGKRDVLRSANFNGNQAMGFVAETGLWQVSGGRYNVEPSQLGGDAVSLFNVDEYIPVYFEVLATVNAVKPTAGFKANAYLVFDYQSPTDFKFAGVNVSTNSLEIGRRTAAGWIVDTKVPMLLKHAQDYNLFLAVNGNAVTLVVNNNTTLTHTFAARRDADGFAHTISEGMIGLGGAGAKAQIDNVVVQKVSLTTEKTTEFTDGTGGLLDAPLSGTWNLFDGRYQATGTSDAPAISLSSVRVAPNSLLELSSRFKLSSPTAEGGFVFDFYSDHDFKFVMISAQTKQVVLGHRTASGWVVDARFNISGFALGTDYTLGISLKGTTVNVTLNGNTVISRTYNGLVTDGAFGLFSRSGQSVFDALTIGSDDRDFI